MTEGILHIGHPKTGSTSIQMTLVANRDRLGRQGVLYPDVPVSKTQHDYLRALSAADLLPTEAFTHRLGSEPDRVRSGARAVHDAVCRAVADTGPATVLMSSESLFRPFSPAELDVLAAALRRLAESWRILAYLRPPAACHISRVQQRLKNSSPIFPLQVYPYRTILEGYERAFGDGSVEVRLFDRGSLRGGDVVEDFLEWTRIPEPAALERISDANESISAEAMAVLNGLGYEDLPTDRESFKARRAFLAIVRAADEALPQPTKPKLRDAAAEWLNRLCVDALWLRDVHGIEFPGFDYGIAGKTDGHAAPQISTLADLCDYDGARAEALARIVREKMAAPVRQGWSKWLPFRRQSATPSPPGFRR